MNDSIHFENQSHQPKIGKTFKILLFLVYKLKIYKKWIKLNVNTRTN